MRPMIMVMDKSGQIGVADPAVGPDHLLNCVENELGAEARSLRLIDAE